MMSSFKKMKACTFFVGILVLQSPVAMAGFLDDLKNVITVTTTTGSGQTNRATNQEVSQPTPALGGDSQCTVYDGFQDNGDGTLTDPRNGLVWQKCAVGQTWNGSTCSGSAESGNWYFAMEKANDNRFLGRSDWRLPTKSEFESVALLDNKCSGLPYYVSPRLMQDKHNIWTITPYGDIEYVSIHQYGGYSYWIRTVTGSGQHISIGKDRRAFTERHDAHLVAGQATTREDATDIEREFKRFARAQAEYHAAEVAEQAQVKAAQEREACLQSNKPKLNEISAAIVQEFSSISFSKERMQQQREGAKYSGFVDKQLMYELGNRIASSERRIKDYFGQYKQLGGTEKNAESVRALRTNPCDALPMVWLTKRELTNLSRLRYAQYGFLDSNSEKIQAVLGLEETIFKSIVYKDGQFSVDEGRLNPRDVFAGFGFGVNDRTETKNFFEWFDKRFKPVYLKHLTALNSVAPFKALEDVEGLSQDEKNRYLESVKYPDGPYDVLINPFPNAGALHADKVAVVKATSVATAAIGK